MTLKPFYDRTEDVHVGAYVAYGHTDGKLYADAEHKAVSYTHLTLPTILRV